MRVAVAPVLLLVAAFARMPVAVAAEGMWQPRQLPAIADALTAAGYDRDPRAIADLDRHPMDAVVSIGGCSASFVSPEGLVVTNHHCAYGTIQINSTGERNLLRDGFLAADRAAELPGDPNLRVFVTDRIDDVTAEVRAAIDAAGDDGAAAWAAYDAKSKALVAACEAAGPYRCELATFHGGLEFNLVRQLEIRDVRLVHAPAGAIGKFGGDVDNWMWPRHTGDYAFLRAYVDRDGKPAAPSKDNVPYRPKSWLRIASEGPKAGDFVMVAGYPGRTNRWRLSEELEDTIAWTMPTVIAANRETLRIIDEATRDRPDAAVKYASAVAGLNNTLKNFEGQLAGFSTVGGKQQRRRKALAEGAMAMQLQAAGDATATARVAALRAQIAANRARRERDFAVGAIVPLATGTTRSGGTGLLATASDLYRLALERGKPDAQREAGFQARDEVRIRGRLEAFDRRYDPAVDRALLRHRITAYAALPAASRLPEFDAWLGISGDQPDLAGVDARLDALYAGTRLGDAKTRMGWFEAGPDALRDSGDSALALVAALQPAIARIEAEAKAAAGRDLALRPAWMQAMIRFQQGQGRAVYPDANGTLRVTYGNIKGYAPRDGVTYLPFTTLAGIVEKTTGVEPFDTPAKQIDAIGKRQGADLRDAALGDVPVNFLSDLDVTGGNSGSPTLNARGELVGLLFDMTWESVASNWVFNPALTRAIHVDARYMVWVMREVDGATHLLREMGVADAR